MNALPMGDLASVLSTFLSGTAPELFSGTPPAVTLSVTGESLTFAPGPNGHDGGILRDARKESLPVDPQQARGPYRLLTPPGPGRRLVRALAGDAVAFTFHDDEVDWSASPDGQSFLLSPRPHHTLDVATDVQVAYSVVAATATLPGKGETTIVLSGAVEPVARARGLLLAVLTLEADQLLEHVRATATEGDYVASQSLTSISVVQAETVTANDGSATCRVTLELTVSVRLERALRDTEGALIERVATVGSTGKGQIAVEPAVDA